MQQFLFKIASNLKQVHEKCIISFKIDLQGAQKWSSFHKEGSDQCKLLKFLKKGNFRLLKNWFFSTAKIWSWARVCRDTILCLSASHSPPKPRNALSKNSLLKIVGSSPLKFSPNLHWLRQTDRHLDMCIVAWALSELTCTNVLVF